MCSKRRKISRWKLLDLHLEPKYCPEAVVQYAEASGNRQSMGTDVKKHLFYLGWRVEFLDDGGRPRYRYTSPDGKFHFSLAKVCEVLRGGDTVGPSPREIRGSGGLHNEVDSGCNSLSVVTAGENCRQAVVDWYRFGAQKNFQSNFSKSDAKAKAREYLSAMDWVFDYHDRSNGKRELRYKSPSGRCYYSLRTACKACMIEGGGSKGVRSNGFSGGGVAICEPTKRSVGVGIDFQIDDQKKKCHLSLERFDVVETQADDQKGILLEDTNQLTESIDAVDIELDDMEKISEELNKLMGGIDVVDVQIDDQKRSSEEGMNQLMGSTDIVDVQTDDRKREFPEDIHLPRESFDVVDAQIDDRKGSFREERNQPTEVMDVVDVQIDEGRRSGEEINQLTESTVVIDVQIDDRRRSSEEGINQVTESADIVQAQLDNGKRKVQEESSRKKTKRGKIIADLRRLRDEAKGYQASRGLRPNNRVRQAIAAPSSSQRNPRTVLSMLMDNKLISPMDRVYYFAGKGRAPLARGKVTRDGVTCDCCFKLFTLSKFEAHAGSTRHRPSANIFLEDGRSLLDCQKSLVEDKETGSITKEPDDEENDEICSVCRNGGDLILCDSCPSSFHQKCIGLVDVPDGKWFCPSCCCGLCRRWNVEESSEQHTSLDSLRCDQCERRYHIGCLGSAGSVKLERQSDGKWFCGGKCERTNLGLRKLLGKQIHVGANNLTWTLLKSIKTGAEILDSPDTEALAEMLSKLNLAVDVMHECFEPVKDVRSGRDLVDEVIFSRGSELNRSNFRGFYTAVLERDDNLISVATVRVFGDEVAEIPFVGTRFQYQRLGMCRILMNELEKQLAQLEVEKLLLPASPGVLGTWINSFGFHEMKDDDRLRFVQFPILDFENTIICQKLLTKTPVKTLPSPDRVDDNGPSPVSEISYDE